jgi:hypothetical protein
VAAAWFSPKRTTLVAHGVEFKIPGANKRRLNTGRRKLTKKAGRESSPQGEVCGKCEKLDMRKIAELEIARCHSLQTSPVSSMSDPNSSSNEWK